MITIDKELARRVLEALLEAERFSDTVGQSEGTWYGREETMDEALKVIPDFRSAIEAQPQEPIAYLAWRDGEPCYEGDDAVCEDPVWPVDSDDDRESMPVYLAPQPAQPQEQTK